MNKQLIRELEILTCYVGDSQFFVDVFNSLIMEVRTIIYYSYSFKEKDRLLKYVSQGSIKNHQKDDFGILYVHHIETENLMRVLGEITESTVLVNKNHDKTIENLLFSAKLILKARKIITGSYSQKETSNLQKIINDVDVSRIHPTCKDEYEVITW